RFMWHSSWIRIAFNWSGDILCVMSFGRTRMGLRMPITAGSNRTCEDMTRTELSLIGKSIRTGEASWRTARTRTQERIQNQTLTPKPHSQMENRTTGSEFILLTAEAAEGVADKAGIRSKGILNSATAE